MKKFFYVVAIGLLLFPAYSYSGAFNVLPIKIFLSAESKAGNLRVKNETPDPTTMQVKAFEWSQDSQGNDVYNPSNDLVYMPRIFSIKGNEERSVKLGYELKPGAVERTFRIYIEEVPQAKASSGNSLQMALRMGIPVFVAPAKKADPKGEITGVAVSGRKLNFRVLNTGNMHLFEKTIRISGVDSAGKSEFSDSKPGWYVLTGKSRPHAIEIPADKCGKLKSLTIEIEHNSGKLNKTINVDKKAC